MQKRMLNTVSVTLHIAWIVGCRAVKRMALVAALVALCVFSGGLAHAGTVYSWTKTMGGASMDYGYSAAVDASGNVYVAGYFAGTADFDPGPDTDNHTSAGGSNDIFLTKINADGTYGWTKTMGGTGDDRGYSAAVDASGNVYVTGWFEGTVDFDSGPGTDNHTSAGNYDIFLTKINADATYGWTKTMGGAINNVGYSAAVDASGNVYVAGYFAGTADFDPGPGPEDNHTSRGMLDIFLTKINSDGTYGWTKTMGGASLDYGRSAAVDGSGNVYVTGSFYLTVDFDPGLGTDNHTSAGGDDIFLTKINSDGTYGWTKTMGGASYDSGHSAAVDASGNVYVTGYFQGTVDFDPGPGTEDSHTSAGRYDIFLTKINSDGTYGWTKTMGGAIDDSGVEATVDASGNVYVTGYFQGTVDFDPGLGTDNHTSAGDDDIFLTKINADGTYGWTKTMGGAIDDSGVEATVDGSGNVYVTGYFVGTVDFDPGPGTDNHTSAGGYDIFLTKFIMESPAGGGGGGGGCFIATVGSGVD